MNWVTCIGSDAANAALHLAAVLIIEETMNSPAKAKDPPMNAATIAALKSHAELMVALSASHLTPSTRRKLVNDNLSVNTYPTDYGGLVFVGSPRYQLPQETDLATIFEAAEQAGITWLKFDSDAAVIEGLPVFDAIDFDE